MKSFAELVLPPGCKWLHGKGPWMITGIARSAFPNAGLEFQEDNEVFVGPGGRPGLVPWSFADGSKLVEGARIEKLIGNYKNPDGLVVYVSAVRMVEP